MSCDYLISIFYYLHHFLHFHRYLRHQPLDTYS